MIENKKKIFWLGCKKCSPLSGAGVVLLDSQKRNLGLSPGSVINHLYRNSEKYKLMIIITKIKCVFSLIILLMLRLWLKLNRGKRKREGTVGKDPNDKGNKWKQKT